MTVSAPRCWSVAGDVVPQNGQTSACLAGFQCASAPHAGQANFSRAVTFGSGIGLGARADRSAEELADRRRPDPPLAADPLAFQIAGLEAGDDGRFRDAEQ